MLFMVIRTVTHRLFFISEDGMLNFLWSKNGEHQTGTQLKGGAVVGGLGPPHSEAGRKPEAEIRMP